jgi:hypothetical protein
MPAIVTFLVVSAGVIAIGLTVYTIIKENEEFRLDMLPA